MVYSVCLVMSAKTKVKHQSGSKSIALKVMQIGFVYVVAYTLMVIAMHAWNLVTPEAETWHWVAAGMLLLVNLGVWYSVKINGTKRHQIALIMLLVFAQILFAALNVYWERGMASAYPVLFVLPIILSTVMKNPKMIYSSAALSAFAYSSSVYRYFYNYYGEGYMVQLWTRICFISVLLLLIAWMLAITTDTKKAN